MHVARMGGCEACIKHFIWEHGEQRLFWSPRRRRKIILKRILIVEYEDVASVQLAQRRDQWRTLANIIMKLCD